MSKIPVIILSGFLGSGKTTLLLRLIQEAKSRKLKTSVLMNELGKNDVDGHILSESIPELCVEKLLDGCICCSLKSEVTGSIAQLLEQKPDVIFIELTGVANPEEIADSLTEPQIKQQVKLKHIITILDAENLLEYNSIFATDRQLIHTLRRQIEVADLLVLNKTDLVSNSILDKIEKTVRKQNKDSELLHTLHSEIEMTSIFADIHQNHLTNEVDHQLDHHKHKTEHKHNHEHQHEHKSFTRVQTHTFTIHESNHLTTKKIEKFLKKYNHQLLRAKGYISIHHKIYLMQYAAKRTSWQSSNYTGDPYLVLIGIDLQLDKIQQDWAEINT